MLLHAPILIIAVFMLISSLHIRFYILHSTDSKVQIIA